MVVMVLWVVVVMMVSIMVLIMVEVMVVAEGGDGVPHPWGEHRGSNGLLRECPAG